MVLFRESLKFFEELEHKRGIARLLECFACSAAAQQQAERALRLAGAAAALRQNIGAPLTAAEQAKLEAILEPARQRFTNTAADGMAGRVGHAGAKERSKRSLAARDGARRQVGA